MSSEQTHQIDRDHDPQYDALYEAYQVALNDHLDEDCVTSTWETPHGQFVIEFGNFRTGLVFNVADLPWGLSPDEFRDRAPQTVLDANGQFIAFQPNSEAADSLVAETMQLASYVDGELVNIKLRHIENMPEWWPDWLHPKNWGWTNVE